MTDSGEITVVRGNLTIDRALRRVVWRGESVRVTAQQFAILELLIQRENRVVQDWVFFVTVFDEDLESNILDAQVCKIRRAFRTVDPQFDQLETIRGEGLRWRFESATEKH